MIWRTLVVCVALIAGLTIYSEYDAARWQNYAAQNSCVETGKTQEYFALQPTWNPALKQWSTTQVFYPAKTIFKCNNGKEFTR